MEERVEESRETPSQLLVMTPHFLHNSWYLPACKAQAGSLSFLEKGVTHSSSCLENTRGRSREQRRRAQATGGTELKSTAEGAEWHLVDKGLGRPG